MKRPKLKLGFAQYRTYTLIEYANHILVCLTENAYFPTIQARLADFEAAIEAYYTALNNQQRFNQESYTVAREKRSLLLLFMANLGTDIETVANGDLKKLQTCGIQLVKQWQRVGELPQTSIKKIVTGIQEGSLLVQAAAIKNANSYVFEYAIAPVTKETEWKSVTNTSSKITLTGLTQGTQYAVRACAVGSNPVRNFSPFVIKYVA